MTTALPTTAARTAAMQAFEKCPCTVLELDIDRCTRTYGVAPCAASGAVGSECYNTFTTCQSKANYNKGTQTLKFISRGAPIPAGESLRSYILSESGAPTVIDPEEGLSRRGMVKLVLADEPDADVETDPYVATRAAPAGGSFWPRFLRRNPNYVGRFARVRRGFVVSPWDWTTFIDELYLIDNIAGPDGSGNVNITLKDPLKLLDRAKIPVATDGKLQLDIGATESSGVISSATSTTAVLPTSASSADGAYVGMELYITGNTGSGQRRTITAYAGASRTCTVSAWSVNPDSTSFYEIGVLQINLGTGKGAQYPDPATSGKQEYIRIDDEIIRYTAKSGDVISWTDTSYRAQFGTTRKEHRADSVVQLCRAWINKRAWREVIKDILNESGLVDGYIDIAALQSEDDTWLGTQYNVTACISAPEASADLVADLLKQTNGVMWWSPATQEVEVKAMMPSVSTPEHFTDDANLIERSVSVAPLDALRITSAAIYYNQKDATSNLSEAKNFNTGDIYIDTDAEGANEYGDKRIDIQYSRWFTAANKVAMHAVMARKLSARRDAPKSIQFKLDSKDYLLPPGAYVDITTRRLTDFSGQPQKTRAMITKTLDRGGVIECEARSTNFARRYAFIAPNTAGAYPADSGYGHMSDAGGLMGDGSSGYLII